MLPYSDPACPGDGTCHDDIQVMIVMKMKQETDMSKKTKSFFQMNIARNASASEKESLNELVKKNETNLNGDLYLEGSQKQLKNMLKNHLLVKPGCLFDNAITLNIKVYYMSTPGTYSEAHTRNVEYEMAQIQKSSIRMELDHQYKYRFLAMSDSGDIVPLYTPS